jgi:hypothetical protein
MFVGVWAQNATSSPSSRFGYGELNDNLPGAYRAMGGVGVGMRSNKAINPAQPASYTACDSMTFMFDIAGSFLYTNYGDANGQRNKVNGNLEYITMQFPIWRQHIAMSLGVTPYSAVGYNFALSDSINSDYHFTKTYSGEGGFTQVYGGLSVNICDWVALGANVYYMFGETTQKRALTFTEASLKSVEQGDYLRVNSLRLRYGAQLFHTFGKHTVVLGGMFENKQRFSNCEYKQLETSTNDTVATMDVGFEMPMVYGAGLSYGYDNRITIGVDYQCQDWSNVLYFNKENVLNARHRWAVGAEYRHDPTSRKFVDRMYWRFGVNFATSYTNQYNQPSMAVTLGFGFPLRTIGTVVNTTLEYGRRGFADGQLNENYLRFVVNAAIAEHWFFKRKL